MSTTYGPKESGEYNIDVSNAQAIRVDLQAAAGEDSSDNTGGNGGRIQGEYDVSDLSELYLYVKKERTGNYAGGDAPDTTTDSSQAGRGAAATNLQDPNSDPIAIAGGGGGAAYDGGDLEDGDGGGGGASKGSGGSGSGLTGIDGEDGSSYGRLSGGDGGSAGGSAAGDGGGWSLDTREIGSPTITTGGGKTSFTSASGEIQLINQLSSVATGNGDAVGNPAVVHGKSGTFQATGNSVGRAHEIRAATSSLAAQGTVGGDAHEIRAVTGSLSGTATSSGVPSLIVGVHGTARGSADALGDLYVLIPVSGQVTLDGSGVGGAYVYVSIGKGTGAYADKFAERHDIEYRLGQAYTNTDGTYSIMAPLRYPKHVSFQYEADDGTQYNAQSKPFIRR